MSKLLNRMKLIFFTLAILFLVKYASSEELMVEKDTSKESKHRADHNSKEVSGDYEYDLEESNGTKSHETADKDSKSYENTFSYEEVEKDTTEKPRNKADHNSKEDDYGYKDVNITDYYNDEKSNGTSAAIICHNDELSLSWFDCLLTDSEVFILFAEINQILLKISFTYSHSLNFHVSTYLVALYLKLVSLGH